MVPAGRGRCRSIRAGSGVWLSALSIRRIASLTEVVIVPGGNDLIDGLHGEVENDDAGEHDADGDLAVDELDRRRPP